LAPAFDFEGDIPHHVWKSVADASERTISVFVSGPGSSSRAASASIYVGLLPGFSEPQARSLPPQRAPSFRRSAERRRE